MFLLLDELEVEAGGFEVADLIDVEGGMSGDEKFELAGELGLEGLAGRGRVCWRGAGVLGRHNV